MTDAQFLALAALTTLTVIGCAAVLAALIYRRATVCSVRYIDFYDSANPKCRHCAGTGWYPDFAERNVGPCYCVSDDTEAPRGNA